jgi:hypothetical protein
VERQFAENHHRPGWQWRIRHSLGYPWIHKFTYLKGLDGQLPQIGGAEKRQPVQAPGQGEKQAGTAGFFDPETAAKSLGYPIGVPIQPDAEWDDVKTFAKAFAERMAKETADRYVATLAKRARKARIFIDYLRNDRGATAVAAYSTRGSPRASVSTPLDWSELSPEIPIGNLLHRLAGQLAAR